MPLFLLAWEVNIKLQTRKEYYTAEEYAAAKSVNIAVFLQQNGYELTRESRCYKGKLHDSLVIRDDGRWYWNSRSLHGYSPVELYKQILLNDYGYTDEMSAAIAAVKQLAGGRGAHTAATPTYAPKPEPARASDTELLLPARHINNNRVLAYLCKTRGLDPDIVKELMRQGKIYETVQSLNKDTNRYEDTPYHNAVFVAYDARGRPQNAFLRGTLSMTDKPFKRDLELSDKSYSFTLPGSTQPSRDTVSCEAFCFESAIDAISHASLYKLTGQEWQYDSRISLGGTSFLGLERFLRENPQITTVISCLDNDATGNRRSETLMRELAQKGYTVEREAPQLKDFNEDLLEYLQEEQEDDLEL